MANLHMGYYDEIPEGRGEMNPAEFLMPVEAQVGTFAVIGVRGSGKTVTATVMAEEFCKHGLFWTAFDPISVWWGLRAKRDGKPGGFPVLVFGGKHGDIPIQKTDGRRIAEIVAHERIFAVVDVKQESKTFWHTFITDLSMGLMDQEPETPRHLFIEEGPEFVPQKPRSDLSKRASEAVERLVRLGRNQGYGTTIIGQRSATINKDVLSQCENIFALRTVGSHDYKAFLEWLIAAGMEKDIARAMLKDLSKLPDGTANFWSPHFMKEFKRVAIRPRETFHPGETRKVGVSAKAVELTPIHEIVSRIQKRLTKVVAAVPGPSEEAPPKGRKEKDHEQVYKTVEPIRVHPETTEEITKLKTALDSARAENARLRSDNAALVAKMAGVRKALEPQYKALQNLFGEIGTSSASVDYAQYEEWLKKAGVRGCRRILEVMLEKQSLKAIQLATLSGISYRTLKNYRGWLKSNGLVEIAGEGEDAQFTLVPMA